MTKDKTRKRFVRQRAAKTGESYTAALRQLRLREEKTMETATDNETAGTATARCSLCGSEADGTRTMLVAEAMTLCGACVERFRTLSERAEPGQVVRLMPQASHTDAKEAVSWAIRSGSPTGRVIAARMAAGELGISPTEVQAMKDEWEGAGRPPSATHD